MSPQLKHGILCFKLLCVYGFTLIIIHEIVVPTFSIVCILYIMDNEYNVILSILGIIINYYNDVPNIVYF